MAALEQIKGGALNDIELEFTRVAVTIISSDMQLMTRADKNELFRFEDFTTDLNTFSQLLKTIVNGVFEIEETFELSISFTGHQQASFEQRWQSRRGFLDGVICLSRFI